MTREELNARYQLGVSYEAEGNKAKAEKEYDLIIDKALDEPDLRYKAFKAKLYLNVENAQARNNIVALMTDLFAKNEEFAEGLYYDLSQFHKITGDTERLMNSLDQLTTRFVNGKYYADSLLELALAYQYNKQNVGLAMKNYVAFLNKVGKKHNGSRVAALNLAECYNASRQPAEARAILKKYLNIE